MRVRMKMLCRSLQGLNTDKVGIQRQAHERRCKLRKQRLQPLGAGIASQVRRGVLDHCTGETLRLVVMQCALAIALLFMPQQHDRNVFAQPGCVVSHKAPTSVVGCPARRLAGRWRSIGQPAVGPLLQIVCIEYVVTQYRFA